MTNNEVMNCLEYCASENCDCSKCKLYVVDDDDCNCSRQLKLKAVEIYKKQQSDLLNLNKQLTKALEKSAINKTKVIDCEKELNRLQAKKQDLEIKLKAMRGAANAYKAENERLEKNIETETNHITRLENQIERLLQRIKTIKSEAYKEFAERLKKKYKPYVILGSEVAEIEIDNLLKEIIGE